MYQIKTNLSHACDTVCYTETFLLTIREIAGAPPSRKWHHCYVFTGQAVQEC